MVEAGADFAITLAKLTEPFDRLSIIEVTDFGIASQIKVWHVSTVGKHRLAEKAAAYEGRAQLCASKARELDHSAGRWTDWDGAERPWRAVDVERAFFGLGRT